jgi:DNA-directed RNA polymerase specialized sigma24 family protein
MDRPTAIERLPTAYAIALRLNDEGASHTRIARMLDVPVQAVPRLLEIGSSKLHAILAERAMRDNRSVRPRSTSG